MPSAKKRAPVTEITPESSPGEGKIKTKIVAPLQSAGRLGKSTFVDLLLSWLDHAGIESYAVDCDAAHGTLSQRYDVPSMSLADQDAMENLLHAIVSNPDPAPVVALDFPAQATDQILGEWKRLFALDVLEASGFRLVIPLFLVDDAAAVESLVKIVHALGNRADYVLVRNPARGPYERPDASRMAQRLREAGAATITLPALTKATRDAIAAAERQAEKRLPLAEATPNLGLIHRVQLEGFIGSVWKQMEDAAELLLPDKSFIRHPVSEARVARLAAEEPAKFINRLDPME